MSVWDHCVEGDEINSQHQGIRGKWDWKGTENFRDIFDIFDVEGRN